MSFPFFSNNYVYLLLFTSTFVCKDWSINNQINQSTYIHLNGWMEGWMDGYNYLWGTSSIHDSCLVQLLFCILSCLFGVQLSIFSSQFSFILTTAYKLSVRTTTRQVVRARTTLTFAFHTKSDPETSSNISLWKTERII